MYKFFHLKQMILGLMRFASCHSPRQVAGGGSSDINRNRLKNLLKT